MRSATSWPSKDSSKKLIDIAQDAPATVILAEDEISLYLRAPGTAVASASECAAAAGVGPRAVASGEAIREVQAANPRLEIVQFPVAAPDLNPQEHVWKAARAAVSHNHTACQLSTLATRFHAHVTDTTFPTSFLENRGFYTVHPRSI